VVPDAAQRRFTLEDYWAVELASPLRHEYVRGAIYAMAGGTPRHNEIAANVQHALRNALEDTGCRPVGSDQRIRTVEGEYTYADVSVFCGSIDVAPGPPPDTATNPVLLVEVLSGSTRAYDHGDKREMYQRIPSVRAIWLVEPDEPHVTVWTRTADGWTATTYDDRTAEVPALERSVSLADVYATALT
jgi:Uma2 family endonuclease